MRKELIILHGEIKSPPLSREVRREAGYLLRRLQDGDLLEMPHARPMPSIGKKCYELRLNDAGKTWRLIYRLDADAVIIAAVFCKKTRTTPDTVIQECRKRLKHYDSI